MRIYSKNDLFESSPRKIQNAACTIFFRSFGVLAFVDFVIVKVWWWRWGPCWVCRRRRREMSTMCIWRRARARRSSNSSAAAFFSFSPRWIFSSLGSWDWSDKRWKIRFSQRRKKNQHAFCGDPHQTLAVTAFIYMYIQSAFLRAQKDALSQKLLNMQSANKEHHQFYWVGNFQK